MQSIIFGSGYVSILRIAKTGIVLDIAAAATLWVYFAVRHFGFR